MKQAGQQLEPEKLIDDLKSIRNLGRGAMRKLGRAEHQASYKIRGTALDETEAWRSNSNDRRLSGIARGADANRDRAGSVNRYVLLPSLSTTRRPSEKGRALCDIGHVATPTGDEATRQLKRPALFLEPAPMWLATIPLFQKTSIIATPPDEIGTHQKKEQK